MKVRCQYCNNVFDLNENSKCPECGAEINQKDIEEYKKLEYREKLIEIEQKELDIRKNEHKLEKDKRIYNEQIKQKKAQKNFISIYIVVIIFLFVIIPVGGFLISVASDTINTYEEISQKKEEPVDVETVVSFNEKAQMLQYSIICDKAEEWVYDTDDAIKKYCQPKEGYKHMRFHFIIENTSDKTYYDRKDFIVSTDGFECEKIGILTDEANASMLDDGELSAGLKKQGYIYREIPKDAKEIKIQYGEHVTINVSLP